MLTSSTQLQNRSFHVVERARTSSKCHKMKNARAKRAKTLFFIVKYANLWGFCCRRRRGCLSSLMRVATTNSFSVQLVVVMHVFSLLNKLSKSKATGLDNISAKLSRECTDLILITLCNIFNNSLSSGLFPDDWKCARVTPLFKQGERTDVNNYRPISVISIIAKVFERIVYCIVFWLMKR